MSDTLLLLGAEHKNFSELLSLIDEQRRSLQKGEAVDIDLLQHVAEYFNGYPDTCHHPVEELVLRRLCMRDSEALPDPDRLSEEHRELARLTKRLASTLTATAQSRDATSPELIAILEEFVDYYRNHMSMEEHHFFSAAAKALTAADWDEIDLGVFNSDDPLFDSAVHARFHKLRKRIEKSASEFSKRSVGVRQVRRVQRLGGMSEFNNSMLGRGLLVHHPQGGYALELDGQTVIDIPECGEMYAVWCAYYFLQGRALGERGYPGDD